MKNIILVPIYIGHASRFIQLCLNLRQVDLSGVDVAFMVSNQFEKNYFQRLAKNIFPKCLIIDSEKKAELKGKNSSLRLSGNEERSAINLKKIVGLQYAADHGYDYAACLDSDIYLLPQFNAAEFFELAIANYNKCEYFGVNTDHPDFMAPFKKTLMLFSKDVSINNMPSSMETWFPWFFEAPIYSLMEFKQFDAYMESQWGEWYLKINWFTFDHLVFIAWKILCKGAKMHDYSAITKSIPEFLTNTELQLISDMYGYKPAWLSATNFVYFPEILAQRPEIKLLNHADRVQDVKLNTH